MVTHIINEGKLADSNPYFDNWKVAGNSLEEQKERVIKFYDALDKQNMIFN